jgi:hypothetical protein
MYALVSQWKKGGLSQKDFCSNQSIPIKTFQYWLRKFRSENKTPGFLPVAVDSPEIDIPMEIVYPSGVRLVIRQSVSTGELKSLLTLI